MYDGLNGRPGDGRGGWTCGIGMHGASKWRGTVLYLMDLRSMESGVWVRSKVSWTRRIGTFKQMGGWLVIARRTFTTFRLT